MRSVRLSLKSAEVIVGRGWADGDQEHERALSELNRAAQRVRGLQKKADDRKLDRIQERRAAVGPVRLAVMARAQGRCESCGRVDRRPGERKRYALHMDHFFEKSAESLETCWALCDDCHDRKHKMRPSLPFWFLAFATHAVTHGYSSEAEEATRLAGVYRDRNALPASPKVNP